MIPPFDDDGNLQPGIHAATWDEFKRRYGTTRHRRSLLKGLRTALGILRTAGCRRAYVDGSFVTAKQAPQDVDVAWEPADVAGSTFLEFFQIDKTTGNPKGIVAIDL